jgi:hypothetical protein
VGTTVAAGSGAREARRVVSQVNVGAKPSLVNRLNSGRRLLQPERLHAEGSFASHERPWPAGFFATRNEMRTAVIP